MPTNEKSQSVKITKTVVDKAPIPEGEPTFIRDNQLKGFGVRITNKGTKSFVVEKRINGRNRRMTLGRYGELTVEQARTLAQRTLGKIAFGEDPAAEKQRKLAQGTTLKQAFHEFKKTRGKKLRPKTLYDYERFMDVAFKKWQSRPIVSITRTMIRQTHQEMGETRGEAYANGSMRFLRSLLNFSSAAFEDGTGHSILPDNPVLVLTQTRAWYRPQRRRTVIKTYQLPVWYQAVMKLKAPLQPAGFETVADCLLLLLFTGLRKSEALTLKWSQIDLQDYTLTLPDPKNHEEHVLPLSDFIHELLRLRLENAVNEYVFPGKDGVSYLVEPKRQVSKVVELSGVSFTLHDLRRTFITAAESIDIAPYTIKRLANHKISGDVTAGYIVSDTERLRTPMQKITNFLLEKTAAVPSKTVVDITQYQQSKQTGKG